MRTRRRTSDCSSWRSCSAKNLRRRRKHYYSMRSQMKRRRRKSGSNLRRSLRHCWTMRSLRHCLRRRMKIHYYSSYSGSSYWTKRIPNYLKNCSRRYLKNCSMSWTPSWTMTMMSETTRRNCYSGLSLRRTMRHSRTSWKRY